MRRSLLVLAAVVLGSVLWMLRWDTAPQRAYPDTFWYARQAAAAAGMPAAESERFAARTACRYGLPLMPEQTECRSGIQAYAAQFNDRYDRIFTTRPGYPLMVAPFVWAFGERGMVMATAALGVASGVLIAVGVRILGGSVVQSLAATALLYLLPTGFWATRLLAESGALAAMLATLCCATLVLRGGASRRRRLGWAALTFLALVVLTLVKPATGVLLAAGIVGAVVLVSVRDLLVERRLDPGASLLGATAVVLVLGWQVVGALLGVPGAEETLQDKFTVNFTLPDVPDPWSRLLDMNRAFWPGQLNGWLNGGAPFAASPFLAFLLAGMLAVAWAAPGRMALVWLAAGGTGVLSVVAHPVGSEVDRLIVYIWLPVAAGLALALRPPRPAVEPTRTPAHGGEPRDPRILT